MSDKTEEIGSCEFGIASECPMEDEDHRPECVCEVLYARSYRGQRATQVLSNCRLDSVGCKAAWRLKLATAQATLDSKIKADLSTLYLNLPTRPIQEAKLSARLAPFCRCRMRELLTSCW